MQKQKKRIAGWVIALVIGGIAILPLILYRLVFAGVPVVSPQQAADRLAKKQALLVDIRSAADYERSHWPGAVNWPLAEIMSSPGTGQLPQALTGKTLLVICHSGYQSVRAVRRLRALGIGNIYNVRGGMVDWIAAATTSGGRSIRTTETKNSLPEKKSPLHEQIVLVAAGFAIKPFYMLLSLLLALYLWRKKVQAADLRALQWAMVAFFLGEAFCLLNTFIYGGMSYLFEYLHSFGMVLSFGFVTYALFETSDQRLIHFSNAQERCSLLAYCRRCYKTSPVACNLSWIFLFVSLSGLLLAFIPLTAGLYPVSYNSFIFGTYYNFSNPLVPQLFEIRFCPLAAAFLFAWAFLLLLLQQQKAVRLAKKVFAAGAGYLGFSFFRLFLFAPYHDNLVWLTFWEEATEAVFILGTAIILWLFRNSLFAGKDRA